MIMRHRLIVLGLLWVCGCGTIPTAPDLGVADGELVYVNDTWGFQVSRPTTDWGISAQTFLTQRYPNGLPAVEIHIASPITESLGAAFRPELFLMAKAVSDGIDIVELANAFEENELKVYFGGYGVIEEKQKVTIAGGELIVWQFRNAPSALPSQWVPGTSFLAAIAVHKDQGYFMIGNGSNDVGYPVAEYRKIVESIRFNSGK
jgi:hypothetical protein